MKEVIRWAEDYEEIDKGRLLIRCKNCKHYSTDTWGVVNGLPLIIAHDICDFWGDGCKTDPEGFCFMGEKNERNG